VFIFFKHEDEGVGPKLAKQFLALADKGEEKKESAPARKPGRKG
jgi:hypothetical protein